MADTGPVATVAVTSAWTSKINATQAVSIASSMLVLFGGPEAGLTPTEQASIVVVINLVAGVVTWVMKTWFTDHVHAASLTK